MDTPPLSEAEIAAQEEADDFYLCEHDYLDCAFSDYHKEVHGYRPRVQSEAELLECYKNLRYTMALRWSTSAGRQELKRDGWVIDTPEPTYLDLEKQGQLGEALRENDLDKFKATLQTGTEGLELENLLIRAAWDGKRDFAGELTQAGAKIDERAKYIAAAQGHLGILQDWAQQGLLSQKDQSHVMAVAATYNHNECVNAFLEAETADHRNFALRNAIGAQNKEALQLLLEKNPDVNHPRGQPLATAVYRNDMEAAQMLLERGANPLLSPKETPKAAPIFQTNNPQMLKLLLEHTEPTSVQQAREIAEHARGIEPSTAVTWLAEVLKDRTGRRQER